MTNAQFLGATQVTNPVQNQMMPIMFDSEPAPKTQMRKRRPRGIGDKNGGEKRRVKERLSGFVAKESVIWSEIKRRFGENLRHGELLSIAEVVSLYSGIFLDRDAKRRKTVLTKWFQENWVAILPYLTFVVLEDRTKKKPGEEGEGPQTATMNPMMFPRR